jgi:DNA-binding MarR family transcriptional regulator
MTALSENIHRLHKLGYSYNQIKAQLGCSKGTISYHLGAGQKEKTVTRTRDSRNNIRKYIQEVKQGQVCVDCKEDYPYWMMEFDHTSDDKLFTIGRFQEITSDIEKIKLEIEKCEIVCANCHRNRTYARRTAIASNIMDVEQFYTK